MNPRYLPGLLLFSILPAQDFALVGPDLRLDGLRARYVQFTDAFAFPFGGVDYAGMWVHGNGYVSFGGLGIGAREPMIDEFLRRGDEFDLAGGVPRIAPLWADLSPSTAGFGGEYGSVHAGPGAVGEYRVTWLNVPVRNRPGTSATFMLTLRRDGSFACRYHKVIVGSGQTILAGFSAGHAHTTGAEPAVDLSAAGGAIGNGSQNAIYEYFAGAPFDLDGRTLEFAAARPGSGLLSLAGDDCAQVDLGFPFPFYGSRYPSAWVSSNGDVNFVGWSPFHMMQSDIHITHDTARIIPFGADLNPFGGGTVRVQRGSNEITFAWQDVPHTEATDRNTFSVTLRRDGSFSFSYGRIEATAKPDALVVVGATGGYPVADGSEPPTTFSRNGTYGDGQQAAVYQTWTGPTSFPLANGILSFRPFTRPSALPLIADFARSTSHRFVFPAGFAFPFAGESYTEMFVNGNGTITFTGADDDHDPATGDLLDGFPRLAALWTRFNPKPDTSSNSGEGRITVQAAADRVTVSYRLSSARWPAAPNVNDFDVVLHRDGRHQFVYRGLASPSGLVGTSAGGDWARGRGAWRDLSATSPLQRTGEAAVYQLFDGIEFRVDLANRTLSWPATSGIFAGGRLHIDDRVSLGIQAGRRDAAALYVMALSLSASFGVPLPGGLRFPLDADDLLLLSLIDGVAYFPGFQGALDSRGRNPWPAFVCPDEPAFVGLGFHAAWLSIAASGFRQTSDAALLQAAAAAPGCKVAIAKNQVGNGMSVTITVTSGGVPCVGTWVSTWLYNGNAGAGAGPVAIPGAGLTDGNGQITFNVNQAVAMQRPIIKVRTAGNCCGGMFVQMNL